MKPLKVVITSGGTREYIDDVRVLTNISSGKLGAKIANVFIKNGHEVTYVAPKNAKMPAAYFTGIYNPRYVSDTASVMEVMEELVPEADVVIQAMAVSDFGFDLQEATKLSSGDPEAFVEHLRKTIKKTPKIISNLRVWSPNAVLVGFKFTVGQSYDELHKIAIKLMEDNKLDMVFANDKVMMQEADSHVGYLITRGDSKQFNSKDEIAEGIYEAVWTKHINS